MAFPLVSNNPQQVAMLDTNAMNNTPENSNPNNTHDTFALAAAAQNGQNPFQSSLAVVANSGSNTGNGAAGGGLGRRVTIGGMNNNNNYAASMMAQHTGSQGRRSSLGFDQSLNDIFLRRNSGINGNGGPGGSDPIGSLAASRRPSGFGDLDLLTGRRDSILGGGPSGGMGMNMGMNTGIGMNMGMNTGVPSSAAAVTSGRRDSLLGGGGSGGTERRNSLDSSTAVLDAAIMDLTRKRLSMAMGNPSGAGADFNNGFGATADSMMAAAASRLPMGGFNAGSQSFLGANGGMSSGFSGVTASDINAQQQQVQELQRELDRRKRQLEMEHQQILRGIEEGKMAMSQLQQNLSGNMNNALTSQQMSNARNHALLMGRSSGLGFSPGMIVCRYCNNNAFMSREEALRHEAVCGGSTLRNNLLGQNGNLNMVSGSNPFCGADDADLSAFMAANSGMTGAMPNTAPNTVTPVSPKRRLSLDASSVSRPANSTSKLSTGPFAQMKEPMPLSMQSDRDWLTPLHCFVRQHCVEVFTASDKNVAAPSKGKRKPIHVGQVGIRCPHCHKKDGSSACERGSVYYPTSIASIYNATMNLLQRHLHSCPSVPDSVMRQYESLKADDARSGTSKRYWIESAHSLGLVDTANGIRFSALTPPPLPSLSRQQEPDDNFNSARRDSDAFFSSDSNAITQLATSRNSGDASAGKGGKSDINISVTERNIAQSAPLVTAEDEPYATGFSFHLLSQMQPCKFTEADRLGKRKGLPPGFTGLACRHCFGGYGSGRFFPSSIKTLSDTSKTLNVLHNHMMRCRKCPQEVRDTLEKLRATHDEERAKMKFGSQKAFFARIWDRLHGTDSATAPGRSLKRNLKIHQNAQAKTAGSNITGTLNIDSRTATEFTGLGQMPPTPEMLNMLALQQQQQQRQHRMQRGPAKKRRMS